MTRLTCALCTGTSVQKQWHQYEVRGEQHHPHGPLCWECGTVQESHLQPDMTTDDFLKKVQQDASFRADVQSSIACLAELGRKPPTANSCLKCTQVAQGLVTGVRLRWELSFGTEDNFNAYFRIPPSSLQGVRLASLPGINGDLVTGVLIQFSNDWPPELPYSTAEVYTKRTVIMLDYAHDKGDLHQRHGGYTNNIVRQTLMGQQPDDFQSSTKVTNALSLQTLQAKVDKMKEKRDEASKQLSELTTIAAPVRIAGSRLQASLATTPVPAPISATAKKAPRSQPRPAAGRNSGLGILQMARLRQSRTRARAAQARDRFPRRGRAPIPQLRPPSCGAGAPQQVFRAWPSTLATTSLSRWARRRRAGTRRRRSSHISGIFEPRSFGQLARCKGAGEIGRGPRPQQGHYHL